ncbi:Uncharacterized protein dnm_044800 [Desulfonema magnum]|uniref:Uncharacterized protein n=1 Tax=Desulfonema magnum TaxID=45655 RepID=A0A975BNU6_9BACT|nr:Uncharacterized protein dnm_044800 [Desulfonema magnum]
MSIILLKDSRPICIKDRTHFFLHAANFPGMYFLLGTAA